MSAPSVVALVLALAMLFGVARTWRARMPRRTLRCTLQIAIAIALYLCLFPPTTSERTTRGELVVLAPGATASQIDAAHGDVVALPGVEVPRAIERVPDLATALRHHADARSLRIVGGGLPSRDRDAARGLVAAFDAAPLPHGIVELDASPAVTAGSLWRVQGRVEGTPNGRVELRDPAGAVAASAQLDGDGRFALTASAKAAGPARFSLRAFDAEGERVDDIDVPLVVREGSALRVLLFAGAPDAQLKYLRRWAADAGLALDSRIGLSEGVALTEGAAKLDAASLANADLAIVDERAWATLDAVQKDALRAAVRDGLGLLLRATGPLPDAIAQDWKAFGFDVQAAETAHAVSLDRVIGLADSRLTFTPLPFAITASDTAPLLRADDGTPLALSRVVGRGRVGIAWFTDEWRVALAGHRGAYATLWSGIVAQLARAHGAGAPALPANARVGERAAFCDLVDGDAVEDASGRHTALLVEANPSGARCAAFWPREAGWHALVRRSDRSSFFVRAADAAVALTRASDARATRACLARLRMPCRKRAKRRGRVGRFSWLSSR
jgi:hypothetical protein